MYPDRLARNVAVGQFRTERIGYAVVVVSNSGKNIAREFISYQIRPIGLHAPSVAER